ncbi:MAG: TolC family protein [Verrucomicrobia bacterium]|nr:TolC family protein [Verrucomicrobiota bacterium]
MIRHFSTLLLGIFSLIQVSTAGAQTLEFLDVKEAVILSLQQNLSLRIEGVQLLNSQEEIIIQKSEFDTTLFASGTQRGSRSADYGEFIGGNQTHNSMVRAGVSKYLNSGAEVQVTTNYARNSSGGSSQILNPAHTSDVGLSLRQPLLEGRGSEYNLIPLLQAGIEAKRAELFLKRTALQIMEVAESAYWDLAYAREVQKVRIASLEVAEKLLEENEERERVGLATNIDVLQSQVFLATSREAVISADALIDSSQDRLFRQMGSNNYPESSVPISPLPDISTEEIGTSTALPTILANNPNYLQQQLNIESWELSVKSRRNSTLPRVDLIAGIGFSGLDDGLIDSYGNTLELDGYDWSAGIEFSVPWGQRSDKARYQQTRNNLYREQLVLEDIGQDIKVINRSNWRNWVTGIERVKAAKLSLDLAIEQFDRERTKYESGLATFRELLQAREDQDEANLRYLNSILGAINAQIINMALDASLPQRYGLSWETTANLIYPLEETNP